MRNMTKKEIQLTVARDCAFVASITLPSLSEALKAAPIGSAKWQVLLMACHDAQAKIDLANDLAFEVEYEIVGQ